MKTNQFVPVGEGLKQAATEHRHVFVVWRGMEDDPEAQEGYRLLGVRDDAVLLQQYNGPTGRVAIKAKTWHLLADIVRVWDYVQGAPYNMVTLYGEPWRPEGE